MKQSKQCGGCGKRKKLTEYHVQSDKPDGRASRCKVCKSEHSKHVRRNDPVVRERQDAHAKAYRMALYRLRDDYPRKFERHLQELKKEVGL